MTATRTGCAVELSIAASGSKILEAFRDPLGRPRMGGYLGDEKHGILLMDARPPVVSGMWEVDLRLLNRAADPEFEDCAQVVELAMQRLRAATPELIASMTGIEVRVDAS